MSAERPDLFRDQRGTTAAEFAIVLPVFILILMAGLQFGWAQHCSGALGFALEKGARSLVLSPTQDEASVRSIVLGNLDSGIAAKVTVSLTKTTSADGSQVARLTGVYTEQIGLPYVAALPFKTTRVLVTPLPT